MTDKRKRRWPRWWHLYLPLMLASFLVQNVTDGPGPAPSTYEAATLQPQGRAGAIDQRTISRPDFEVKRPADVELAYQTLGPDDGPIVILLHGSPGDGSNFTSPVEDADGDKQPPMA